MVYFIINLRTQLFFVAYTYATKTWCECQNTRRHLSRNEMMRNVN